MDAQVINQNPPTLILDCYQYSHLTLTKHRKCSKYWKIFPLLSYSIWQKQKDKSDSSQLFVVKNKGTKWSTVCLILWNCWEIVLVESLSLMMSVGDDFVRLIACQVQTCLDEAATKWSQQERLSRALDNPCRSQQDMTAANTHTHFIQVTCYDSIEIPGLNKQLNRKRCYWQNWSF